MVSLKKIIPICTILITFLSPTQAQKVETGKDHQRIKGSNANGHYTELEGSMEDVNTALTKYLRSFGKLKLGATPITVVEYVIGSTQYTTPIYALTKESSTKTIAWMGIRLEEWTDTAQAKTVDKELNRLIYEFGVKYYRDKIQVQVDESVRAQQAVEKQQQRLLTDSKNLQIRLENNQKEKIQLEKSLEVNKLEYLNLLTKIDQNKKDQDSLAITIDQVKKMVEIHKEKQKKIN